MTLSVPAPSLPQTVVLLRLSRGETVPPMPPTTRAILRDRRWIVALAIRGPGSKDKRSYEITESGRRALATSPYITQAQREVDLGRPLASWH